MESTDTRMPGEHIDPKSSHAQDRPKDIIAPTAVLLLAEPPLAAALATVRANAGYSQIT